jgi:serine/threonine-protein kinase RsbW
VQFETTLPAEISAISDAVDAVLGLVRNSGRAHGKEFEIEMALREALANAIVHGCQSDPTKYVEFGMDFNDAGGRGVFLIHTLMDEVRYERGGTEIHMRKY